MEIQPSDELLGKAKDPILKSLAKRESMIDCEGQMKREVLVIPNCFIIVYFPAVITNTVKDRPPITTTFN